MNILQYIAIEQAKALFELMKNAANPDLFIFLCNDVLFGESEEDVFYDSFLYRYWMICQKILCAALLLLHKSFCMSDVLPFVFLKESFHMPSPDDYMTLMCASTDTALGIGTPGTWELQKRLYELLGWKIHHMDFIVDEWDEMEQYNLFFHVRQYIARRNWVKTMGLINDCCSDYGSQPYTLLFLRYPALSPWDVEYVYSDLFICSGFLHLPDEHMLVYVIPSEFYCIDNMDERQDLSSMNPYGLFYAFKKSLGTSAPMLPDFLS